MKELTEYQAILRFRDMGDGSVQIDLKLEGDDAKLTPAQEAAVAYFEVQFPELVEGLKSQH